MRGSVRWSIGCQGTAALAMVVSVLAGARWGAADPVPDDTFVMALSGRPTTFDPREVVRNIESRVVNNLFEGLYMAPVGEGAVVPAVAESYDLSDDGRTYTFHLRDTAAWSNGDPVTAQDFVYAWLRVLEPGEDRPYAYLMQGIRNAREYTAGEVTANDVGLTAVDDHTLRVELTEPVPFFIELTAFSTFFPVHRATVQLLGENAFDAGSLVSDGPYRIESFDPDHELRLAQNEHYWDRSSLHIAHVSMRIFSEEGAGLQAYLDGDVEWLDELPWDRLSSLRFREDFHTHPMFGTYYLRINLTDPVMADARVRQALSMAIDRDSLCRHVLDELCTPASSFVPPMPDFEPIGALPYNPQEARTLLADAGYENGAGFPRLRVMYNTLELHQRIMEAIVEMWRTNLKIEVDLVPVPWEGYMEALDTMDYQVARFGWIGDYLDPDSFIYLMVSENVTMNGGWHNETYDDLARQASLEENPVHRHELYRAAEAILLTELPVIPLFYYTQYQLIRPDIAGFEMNLRDVHLVRYIHKQATG